MMLNAAMKGDNSFKPSLNKVFTKVYGDKGAKFSNLYAQLTQTSGAFINSKTNANLAKAQMLTAYENGQDRYDVQVAWASVAGGLLSGRVSSSLGINSVTNITKIGPAINIVAGKNFKTHFLRHKKLLEKVTGKRYSKVAEDGPKFLKDIGKLIDNETVKFVGQGTLNRDSDLLNIFRGKGITIAVKPNGEWVTILESGKGMDINIFWK
jgi:hypothetical protein